MTTDDEGELAAAMREAMTKARGYADFLGWATNRDLEEWGVLLALRESLEFQGRPFNYRDITVRGRPNDPPDCEARSADGHRIAVEVTELVSEDAIRAYKVGRVYDFANWERDAFISALSATIARKDAKHTQLKDPPYDGGYELIVFTDEPVLSRNTVESYLSGHAFDRPKNLSRVVLVLGYDPGVKSCPVYELPLRA